MHGQISVRTPPFLLAAACHLTEIGPRCLESGDKAVSAAHGRPSPSSIHYARSLIPWRPIGTIVGLNGFTLMELLIVISIVLILMLMSIPTVGAIKKHANETSAVNSVQTIVTAEIMYASSYPAKGFACSLVVLGGDPVSGPPTAEAAQLIQPDLASGYKSGYVFTITKCVKTSRDYVKGYTVTAVPETVGKTGDRGFCMDQNGGSPTYDPAGGSNCTELLQ